MSTVIVKNHIQVDYVHGLWDIKHIPEYQIQVVYPQFMGYKTYSRTSNTSGLCQQFMGYKTYPRTSNTSGPCLYSRTSDINDS